MTTELVDKLLDINQYFMSYCNEVLKFIPKENDFTIKLRNWLMNDFRGLTKKLKLDWTDRQSIMYHDNFISGMVQTIIDNPWKDKKKLNYDITFLLANYIPLEKPFPYIINNTFFNDFMEGKGEFIQFQIDGKTRSEEIEFIIERAFIYYVFYKIIKITITKL